MERWNFDFIFSGTLDERGRKATTFLHGAERLTERAQEEFAKAHLTGEAPERRWSELKDLQEMEVAFCQDPRTRSILVEKTTQKFDGLLREAVNSIFEKLNQAARDEREGK